MAGQQTPLITGATENTPKSILLSAGTIHRGLIEIAKSGEEGQQQTDNGPHLPPDWLGLWGRISGAATTALSRG